MVLSGTKTGPKLEIDEALGARLATLHNLRFYLRLLEEARDAIAAGRLGALQTEIEETEATLSD